MLDKLPAYGAIPAEKVPLASGIHPTDKPNAPEDLRTGEVRADERLVSGKAHSVSDLPCNFFNVLRGWIEVAANFAKAGDAQPIRQISKPVLRWIYHKTLLPEYACHQVRNAALFNSERSRNRNVIHVAGIFKPQFGAAAADSIVHLAENLIGQDRAGDETQRQVVAKGTDLRQDARDIRGAFEFEEQVVNTAMVNAWKEVADIGFENVSRMQMRSDVGLDALSRDASVTVGGGDQLRQK